MALAVLATSEVDTCHVLPLPCSSDLDGTFKYYRNRKQPVRGRLHVSEEKFYQVDNSLEREYCLGFG